MVVANLLYGTPVEAVSPATGRIFETVAQQWHGFSLSPEYSHDDL